MPQGQRMATHGIQLVKQKNQKQFRPTLQLPSIACDYYSKGKKKNNISLNTKAYEQPFFIPKETLNEFNFYIINVVKLFKTIVIRFN